MLSGLIIFLIGKETIKITIIETNSSHVSTGKYCRWRNFFLRISEIKSFKAQFWCQSVYFGHFALYVFAAIQKISTIQGWDSIAKIAFLFVKLSNSLMVSFDLIYSLRHIHMAWKFRTGHRWKFVQFYIQKTRCIGSGGYLREGSITSNWYRFRSHRKYQSFIFLCCTISFHLVLIDITDFLFVRNFYPESMYRTI